MGKRRIPRSSLAKIKEQYKDSKNNEVTEASEQEHGVVST